jgi:taurine transport system substrate-binding protein
MTHTNHRRKLIAGIASFLFAAVTLAPVHAQAETREVVIGYQDMVVPWRYAQATGAVEKATGYKVTYRSSAAART